MRRDMVVVAVSAAVLLGLGAGIVPDDTRIGLAVLGCLACWLLWIGTLLATGQLRLEEARRFVPVRRAGAT